MADWSPSDDLSSVDVPSVSQSSAQNVRTELESLDDKGDAADLSQWAHRDNQALNTKEKKAPRPLNLPEPKLCSSAVGALDGAKQNPCVMVDPAVCPLLSVNRLLKSCPNR